MAQSDKQNEKLQSGQNINPQDSAAESQNKEDNSPLEMDEPGPIIPSDVGGKSKKTASGRTDKSSIDEEQQHVTSPDSIENQDGSADDETAYGEEYYLKDSYSTDDSLGQSGKSTTKDDLNRKSTDDKVDHSTIPDDSNGGGKDGGGDDNDEDIPPGNPEKKMPFLDHLEELRWTIIRSLIAIFIGAVVCFIFNERIIAVLKAVAPSDKMTLVILGPTDDFVIAIKVAMFAGLMLALPYVAYEFWKFIVPGLLAKEKKLVPPIVFFTVLCFICGGAFAYFIILKFALHFLLTFSDQTVNMIAINKYLGFVVTLILVFGVVFELPVLSFFLSNIGLLTPDFLRSKRRYSIVIIFIVAAILTPPDVMTQLLLAGPLIILYEISIWVSAAVAKKKKEIQVE